MYKRQGLNLPYFIKIGDHRDLLITPYFTCLLYTSPGLVPMFIALTMGMDPERRRAMARRACIIATVLLMLFGLAGETVLGFIGISMPAFRIAGGILLFLTALDMLFERRTQRREGQQPDPHHDPSAVSYTHLDVYKRQAICRNIRTPC